MSKLNYGGQAVIEGVMMRGQQAYAVAVRAPSGEISIQRGALPGVLYRSKLFKLPFLRGLVVLWDSLGLGLRALTWSADVAMEEEEDVSFSGPLAWGTVALSLALGVGLFFLLPLFLVSLVDQHIQSPLLSNLAEGAVRLALFVGYVWGIGFMPEIRRVFAYHGAEHKTINAYEDGAPLEPARIEQYTRAHTRCGTGFLLTVLVMFVLLSTVLGRPPLLLRILSRIILIPAVAGLSYELLKLTARYYDESAILRALMTPNLALQRLTTREPERSMLEVAVAALREVLIAEGLVDQDTAVESAPEPTTGGPAPVQAS